MVSIITVNYNGYKDTLELVESFRQFEDYPHEFIVVDNASPNGDGERLERALGDTTRVDPKRQEPRVRRGEQSGVPGGKGRLHLIHQ